MAIRPCNMICRCIAGLVMPEHDPTGKRHPITPEPVKYMRPTTTTPEQPVKLKVDQYQ